MAKKKLDVTELGLSTLSGDLRDAALDWIRTLSRPWSGLVEHEQREVIDSVSKQADALVRQAVDMIAAQGADVIVASIESVTVKDGIKATIKCQKTEDDLVALGMAEGSTVRLVVLDAADFQGEREPAEPEPDQAELPT